MILVSIKTREHSLNIFFEFIDKLLHGVSPLVGCGFGPSYNVHFRRNANKFAACRYAGQVANRLATCGGL
jgi:hypothetical protein